MKYTSLKNQVFNMAKEKKERADKNWEKVFLDAERGGVDVQKIVAAMDLCNNADQHLFEETLRKEEIERKRF